MTTLQNILQSKRAKGLTVSQLSQMTNIPYGTLSKILAGTTKSIKAEYIDALTLALGIDTSTDSTSTSQPYMGYVKVAASTIDTHLANPAANAKETIARINSLHAQGVKLACFAELSITGYSCGDLMYSHTLLNGALDALNSVIQSTKHLDILFAVGMPLLIDSRLYNCAVVVHMGIILAVVPKTNLPNYNEFYEKRLYHPAPSHNSTITLLGQSVLFGTDIIIVNDSQPSIRLAIEVCEDIWVAIPPSARHTNNGANVVFNLSASNDWAGKSDYRRQLVSGQSAKCICGYIYTSAGIGESTSDGVFGGHNLIAENGALLAESKLFTNSDTIVELDTLYLDAERNKRHNLINELDSNYSYVHYNSNIDTPTSLLRSYSDTPFVMGDPDQYCDSVMQLCSQALAHRLRAIHCQQMVLGLSGGLDSALALLICTRACDILQLPRTNIHCYTMPCFGTTSRTKNNSILLPQQLGASITEIDISASVSLHLSDIGHDGTTADITLENAQARERTQILMDKANMVGGIVIGTGDMSEIALGWCTYNGDHMSMYGVNSSIPKTSIRLIVADQAVKLGGKTKDILLDILHTPISPELIPTTSTTSPQLTEDSVGPYELHDFFLHCIAGCNYSAQKTLFVAHATLGDRYDISTIYRWLRVFIQRFFTQQFKRNSMPDGAKVSYLSLSARTDWRMPSDASSALWLTELDNYYNSLQQ